ncbi:glutamate--tRNA ligase [Fluviicola taffensis]|uniref:Glutamate--tRNA ligase n=1 Tax=Fluviicola taffensis (strain DSM 16823 / NCIMB 13979 / RW262) TaxID=755732 RepID=F2IF58_FLUTR|nr:glutamate--tRNA ligase [Fluviicola taffensis]AEA43532.1 glutamyl-tRNA synthetase [Fluviicola taffensis DSM 16823]
MSSSDVRVRFAPSPTGPLHMGGVRTALYNYLFAKHNNGTFIIRIEDTDQTRFVPGAQEYIMDSLKWCGIIPDEGPGIGGNYGPYVQSERQELYKPYAIGLVDNDKAYYAFDTPEELEAVREQAKLMGMPNWQYNSVTRTNLKNSLTLPADEVKRRLDAGEPFVIRFKMPRNHDVRFEDIVRGWVVVNTNNLDDKVLFKSDGMPTYHLANIVDDHLMKISHVIRGEEWLPSAPMHVLLYQAFGWDAPLFAHLPLLLRPDGNGKLSKRDGDRLGFPVFPANWIAADGEKYSGYRENGYFPGSFINMLAFLGWNPGTTQEIFSMDELIQAFSLERVGKAGAKFDPEKTKWFQQQYLKNTSEKELAQLLKNEFNLTDSEERLEAFCKLMKERATFVKDMMSEGSYLINKPTSYDEQTVSKKWKEDSAALMTEWKNTLEALPTFDPITIETAFKAFLEVKSLGIGAVLPLFRLLITGAGTGPSMFEIASYLGKEECITRMNDGLAKLG